MTFLHERSKSKSPGVHQKVWSVYLDSCSPEEYSWLLPKVLRIFHASPKLFIGCLSRDHSLLQQQVPGPAGALATQTLRLWGQMYPKPCYSATVTLPILSYVSFTYWLPTCASAMAFVSYKFQSPHFCYFIQKDLDETKSLHQLEQITTDRVF
jgi:hypothetical protein